MMKKITYCTAFIVAILSLASCRKEKKPIATLPKGFFNLYEISFNAAATSMATANDAGYVFIGNSTATQSAFENPDIIMFKIDEDGNLLWKKIIGDSLSDYGIKIRQVEDGFLAICTSSKIVNWADPGSNIIYPFEKQFIRLIKIDTDGNIIWEKEMENPNSISTSNITFTKDNGFVLLIRENDNSFNYIKSLMKIDANGNVIWKRQWENTSITALVESISGGLLITGKESNSQDAKVFLQKTDHLGNILWTNYFEPGQITEPNDVKESPDGSIVVAGKINYKPGLLKTDGAGNYILSKDWIDDNNSVEKLIIDQEGNFIMAGIGSVHETFFQKTTKDGDIIWRYSFDKDAMFSPENVIFDLQITDEGELISCGTIDDNFGKTYAWAIKTDVDGKIE